MTRYVFCGNAKAWQRCFGSPNRFEGPGFYNKKSGHMMDMPQRSEVQAPMVMTINFEPYRSCVTGRVVDGQRARREEIAIGKDKGLVPFERIDGHPGGLINKEFAKRGGRRVSEAATEWAKNKKAATAVKTDASGAILAE